MRPRPKNLRIEKRAILDKRRSSLPRSSYYEYRKGPVETGASGAGRDDADYIMSQRDVVRVAKLKGLTLQARVVKRVVKVVAEDETESDDRDKVAFILDGVKRYIDANPGTSRIVDDATIETVIAELSKDEEEMDQNRMQVRRSFASCAAARRHLHPPTLPQHALTPPSPRSS